MLLNLKQVKKYIIDLYDKEKGNYKSVPQAARDLASLAFRKSQDLAAEGVRGRQFHNSYLAEARLREWFRSHDKGKSK